MAESLCILGIKINDRIKEAGNVQRVLTQFGCSIKTRVGLHEVTDSHCSTSGLVILELTGPQGDQEKMKKELGAIQGITVKTMEF
ncbi:MAG TPA: hypothetical protein PL017_05450 [Tenuifilaceae bacterium]|nr:hypothetical protein [Tenuifilaceae bacterium]HPE19154.1 hypothetical protein [Tenuifilaceae bacterium]HPJ45523.1 hypothetical protein [Tenuifilaceae bacterium]HPQ33823.1 hypothetical protein [Tenuifilaceae bacterium]HRX68192.1 hypothetical protein [Tenuifilaceae bacterium]